LHAFFVRNARYIRSSPPARRDARIVYQIAAHPPAADGRALPRPFRLSWARRIGRTS
jgi:hypothetical protein